MLTIGQMAARSGVKVPTIRYYEAEGLLAVPHRTDGGQRRYEPDALDRLRFIRHARALGFDLEDIRALLRLSDQPTVLCENADAVTARALQQTQEKIEQLQRLEGELTRMLAAEHGQSGHCEVLRTLADHERCTAEH